MNNPDFIADPYDQDNFGTVLRYVVDLFKRTVSLIILDDSSYGQEAKNPTSEADEAIIHDKTFEKSTKHLTGFEQ